MANPSPDNLIAQRMRSFPARTGKPDQEGPYGRFIKKDLIDNKQPDNNRRQNDKARHVQMAPKNKPKTRPAKNQTQYELKRPDTSHPNGHILLTNAGLGQSVPFH